MDHTKRGLKSVAVIWVVSERGKVEKGFTPHWDTAGGKTGGITTEGSLNNCRKLEKKKKKRGRNNGGWRKKVSNHRD